MNFKTLIVELEDAGLKVSKIAELTGCKRSTISALKNGQNSDATYKTGKQLERLHAEHCPHSQLTQTG